VGLPVGDAVGDSVGPPEEDTDCDSVEPLVGIPCGAIVKYCINTAPQRIPVFVVSAVAVRFHTYWTFSPQKSGVPVGPPVGEAISVQVDLEDAVADSVGPPVGDLCGVPVGPQLGYAVGEAVGASIGLNC
jgi:hypothetical protein